MAPGINTALEIDPSLEIIQSHVVCLSGSWAWQVIDSSRASYQTVDIGQACEGFLLCHYVEYLRGT